jgi:ribonuclease-3
LSNLPSVSELRDPKTRLQEWSQARGFGLPQYELVKVSGKAHQRKFEISCSVRDGTTMTNGKGSTRRNAEQEAAEKMLASLAEDDTN